MAVRDPLVPPVPGRELTEAALGHRFASPELLREALTHRSALNGRQGPRGRRAAGSGLGSNERLEFLGDRVLGLVMAEWLVERFPAEAEGGLARRHAHLVSEPVIATIAETIGLGDLLSVAPGESRAGVRTKASVIADATEALIGAMYTDAGLEPARRFIRTAWAEAVEGQTEPAKDPKTALQEFLQARGEKVPTYEVVSREGPPHEPVFTVRVQTGEKSGIGSAGIKRLAERQAAEDLMRQLAP